jgi:hypothetical protein
MALQSETSVVNTNPATVTVTVRDTGGPGGEPATVGVYLTVDEGLAVFTNDPATTPGFRRNPSNTLIVWKDQVVPARGQIELTAYLEPAGEEIEGSCVPVDCIVEGLYGGSPYLATPSSVVCFP